MVIFFMATVWFAIKSYAELLIIVSNQSRGLCDGRDILYHSSSAKTSYFQVRVTVGNFKGRAHDLTYYKCNHNCGVWMRKLLR
jgi:hypothetical protein